MTAGVLTRCVTPPRVLSMPETKTRYAARVTNMADINEYAGDVIWLRFISLPETRYRGARRAYRFEYQGDATLAASRATIERNLQRVHLPAAYAVEIVEVAA